MVERPDRAASKFLNSHGLCSDCPCRSKRPCSKSATATYGTTGYPDAVLVLQADGNLVIYDTVCLALWSSGTYNYE